METVSSQNIPSGTQALGRRSSANRILPQRPFLLRCALVAVSVIVLALPARATVLGITQCSDTGFTIQLQGFPNAAVAVQLLLSGNASVVLDTTYNAAAQTIVAVRPAGLAGGTYRANFYVNGVWFLQTDLTICNLTGGGGGTGSPAVLGVTQCNDSNFTIKLQNFANAAVVVQLLTPSGAVTLNTAYDFSAQTLVATRPAGLAGGTYQANFYVNGVWVTQAALMICNLGGGGGGGGTGSATVLGVIQCNDSNFTIQLTNFANAVVVVQLLTPSGDIILNTTYNVAGQTLVAVRPAGLAGGTYQANFYVNGVWVTQAALTICNLGSGGGSGGAGGTNQVLGVTQCSDSNFTIQLQGFANAAVVVQLLLQPSGEIILDTTYNVAGQTLVAVRPAGLAGGTYKANFYVNGVWVAQADLVICNLGGGGGGGTGGGTPGGRTPGFWRNKNGLALITSADLQALGGLCLRTSSGADFNASSKTSLATWMGSSTAVNMAYKLSVQLASTYLSVRHDFTNPNVMVDGSLTVNALIEYANTLLCADGNTPAGDANRAEQERVKDILDRINNGGSF